MYFQRTSLKFWKRAIPGWYFIHNQGCKTFKENHSRGLQQSVSSRLFTMMSCIMGPVFTPPWLPGSKNIITLLKIQNTVWQDSNMMQFGATWIMCALFTWIQTKSQVSLSAEIIFKVLNCVFLKSMLISSSKHSHCKLIIKLNFGEAGLVTYLSENPVFWHQFNKVSQITW